MIEAIAGILGFALLFSIVGVMPLETGSCHGSACTAHGADDCDACPLAPEDGEGWLQAVAGHGRKHG